MVNSLMERFSCRTVLESQHKLACKDALRTYMYIQSCATINSNDTKQYNLHFGDGCYSYNDSN